MKRFFSNKWNWIEIIIALPIVIGLITFIHFKKNTNNTTQPFAYVQLGDHPWLIHIQKNLEPIANQIIQDEILKINSAAVDIPKFYIKKRNIITLLYAQSFDDSLHDIVIKQVQNSLKPIQKPFSKIYFSDHSDWFGKNRSELIIKIHDSHHYLHELRASILKGLQESKTSSSGQSLYDTLNISDANKFDFASHESIGRIDVQKIEQLSNHETVKKIKEKITEALQQIIHEMTESNEIVPSLIEVYGNEFKVIAVMHVK